MNLKIKLAILIFKDLNCLMHSIYFFRMTINVDGNLHDQHHSNEDGCIISTKENSHQLDLTVSSNVSENSFIQNENGVSTKTYVRSNLH